MKVLLQTLLLGCLAAGGLAADLRAERFNVGPDDDWFSLLNGDALQPGDTVSLQSGIYSDSRRLVLSHRGTPASPIVIQAMGGAEVVFRRPDARQNTFNLEGAQYLTLRGLSITAGAAGIRIRGTTNHPAKAITVEEMHIHHINGVAVTCNHPGDDYSGMIFRRNHIHHTAGHGEAFYLGGNNGSAIFHDSEVSENYIHHLDAPEISQGDGIEIKQGSYGNLVARNVIHNTNYPAITVYGASGRTVNRVEENVIWSTNDSAMQVAADCVVRGNWIANEGHCLYSRNHQQAVVGNLDIDGNILIAKGTASAIRIIHPRDSSGSNQLSGPVRIHRNRIVVSEPATAIRIPNDKLIQTGDNVVNEVRLEQRNVTASMIEPSALSSVLTAEHPVWKVLTNADLLRQFQARCTKQTD
ncbi:right-handed parallel beta-helix repeat-containing protein [Rhodopirellula halodulae]|uniref:right-handed parallel beta-helix repeat-containing protein n=1 Tax=Rhodopirellula halodulae TaxID=2894198 RepID=UPI001E407751|nr:right-handed parallel beta-helix repeat-containing protein [Rhodopirellula sp. JC737]MCC9654681.1 right-handed parallel beta-helix repeat-containing protein [Rhodopirellula sp. JC737]